MATPKKPKELHLKTGRPSKYNLEIADKICREISTCTDSLEKICKNNPDFPTAKCIHGWRLDYPEFSNKYDTAKRIQADLLAQEVQAIADDDSGDIMVNENGREVCNTEFVARARLRMDARKWIACKLLPKVYGEKVQNDTTVTIKHEDAIKELE